MEIGVVVIARVGSVSLARCLDALRIAGATPSIHGVSGDGVGMARNRALAACESEVLAIVDDDVIVAPKWLEALQDAWTAAATDVGVIGGPLRARIVEGRPSWLHSGFEGMFAVLDIGCEGIDVDLSTRTFYGGNVSFRVPALRGAAGFWPARGHVDGRDWFSEEHHAQHALARCGWRGRYDPGIAAERLIIEAQVELRTLLRRRLRYGARLATAGGGRPFGTTVKSLASGAGGALFSSDPGVRRMRLIRAAENAGVLLGARLARKDFEPVARSTPFRPSVPPPPAGRHRWRRRRGAVILLYHRITNRARDPLGLSVSPHRFAQHVDVLAKTHRVVALEHVVRERQPGTIAITFDDGYADNVTVAGPLLASRGLPWTLFVSTGHVEERESFWWDEVINLFAHPSPEAAPELQIPIPGGLRAWRVGTSQQRGAACDHVLAALQGLDSKTIAAARDALHAWARVGTLEPTHPPISIEELRALARGDTTIGAHTRTHRGLAYASEAEQREEVVRSRDDLARWLGKPPAAFAYPFGVPGADVDAVTHAIVRSAGFQSAVLNVRGTVTSRTDQFAIPRWAAPNLTGKDFRLWLSHITR